MSHTATVQEIYAAFARGDVPAILAHLAENIDWEYGSTTPDIPVLQRRRGRAQVAGFFESLRNLTLEKFEPKTILENGSIVVVLVDLIATVNATGRVIVEEDEVHIWHFDSSGRVARFRHRVDTHQHVLAWRPSGT